MMHLDLNELPHIFEKFWLWSYNKLNWASFKNKNYIDGSNQSVIDKVKNLVQKQLDTAVDRVLLTTHLSYMGYCFNPISIYLCYNNDKFVACVAEVTNTPWGQSHCYVLSPTEIKKNLYEMNFKKELHVSPFMQMNYTYHLKCYISQSRIIFHIRNIRDNECHFDATLSLRFQAINHISLAVALIKYPIITLKVSAAIYWQALKLYLKGITFIPNNQKHKRD